MSKEQKAHQKLEKEFEGLFRLCCMYAWDRVKNIEFKNYPCFSTDGEYFFVKDGSGYGSTKVASFHINDLVPRKSIK